jgi:hypothetical protein
MVKCSHLSAPTLELIHSQPLKPHLALCGMANRRKVRDEGFPLHRRGEIPFSPGKADSRLPKFSGRITRYSERAQCGRKRRPRKWVSARSQFRPPRPWRPPIGRALAPWHHRIHPPELLLPVYLPNPSSSSSSSTSAGATGYAKGVAVMRARLAALLHVRLGLQHQQVAPVDVMARSRQVEPPSFRHRRSRRAAD